MYPNFNQYFNKTPKITALICLIFFGATNVISIIYGLYSVITSGLSVANFISSALYSVVLIVLLVWLYIVQFNLKNARIGKKIKKNFANGDAERASQLVDEIESELVAPVYSDVSKKKKNRNFIVTKNWVIGSDGRNLFRANAVRLDSIKEAEKTLVTVRNRRSGAEAHYYELEIKDNNNVTYHFQLRNEESMEDAYHEVMSHRV